MRNTSNDVGSQGLMRPVNIIDTGYSDVKLATGETIRTKIQGISPETKMIPAKEIDQRAQKAREAREAADYARMVRLAERSHASRQAAKQKQSQTIIDMESPTPKNGTMTLTMSELKRMGIGTLFSASV